MIAYKLFRKMANGQLAPLFINPRQRIRKGRWLRARMHKTDGFKARRGWHCVPTPHAPHLSMAGRVWCKVEVDEYEVISRPKGHGDNWILAQRMKVICECPEHQTTDYHDALKQAAAIDAAITDAQSGRLDRDQAEEGEDKEGPSFAYPWWQALVGASPRPSHCTL